VNLDARPVSSQLASVGFVAAPAEAAELVAAAAGDAERLERLVARRLTGEPLAWITERIGFGGFDVGVRRGIYVPRWHTEQLARRAAERLPADGVAVDLCTGSGAVAKVLAETRPGARVVATDIDPVAVACATANGIEAHLGDLFDPLPPGLAGTVDVIVAVVPYVPTGALALLSRDTLAFESSRSYDGGPDGTDLLRRVVAASPRFLRPGGWLLLELGGEQIGVLSDDLVIAGFVDPVGIVDEEGDLRAVEARLEGSPEG
jgi:release factor glutamine methyltransferase